VPPEEPEVASSPLPSPAEVGPFRGAAPVELLVHPVMTAPRTAIGATPLPKNAARVAHERKLIDFGHGMRPRVGRQTERRGRRRTPVSHGDVRQAVGSVVFTTRLQSSAMIISSQAVTDASLTVDVALQALPTQHRDLSLLMHVARSTGIAQLASF
jgi:hypothetical protein